MKFSRNKIFPEYCLFSMRFVLNLNNTMMYLNIMKAL